MMWWLIVPVTAYLLGSLSFAWMAGKIQGVDLRQHGSGNLGATNAGRVLGKQWFAAVFIADVLKGLLPQLALTFLQQAGHLSEAGLSAESQQALFLIAAVCAILGHVFTLFHGFKGGKAVATSLGVLIGLVPALAAILLGIWLVVWSAQVWIWKMKKSSSVGLASVVAAAAAPVVHLSWVTAPFAPAQRWLSIFIIILGLLVVWRHRSNIRQLFARPEISS